MLKAERGTMTLNIIDLHCDTIMHFYKGEHLTEMENCHINKDKLIRGGVMAQCFAIFTPTGENAKKWYTGGAGVYVEKAYESYKRELELNSDWLLPAYSPEDIEAHAAEGKISAVLTVEDAVSLEGRIENVKKFYDMGVRIMGITWNHENELGYPNSADPELHGKGLKPFGFAVMERCNELGIVLDVSHLSEGGFWDIANNTKKPFMASHSCARALCSHQRNLTDEQIKALADKGGVIGINFYGLFLNDMKPGDPCRASYEDIIRHLKHIENAGGTDVLAIGSDYDGMRTEMEWGDAGGNQKLIQALEKAFTPEQIDKITHKNALRILKAQG